MLDKIAIRLKDHFGNDFSVSEVEKEFDQDVSEITENDDDRKFRELTDQIFMPTETSDKL